jgi:hypothetical protein
MIAQIVERTGKRPDEYLVDGGYTALDAIDAVEAAGTTVYAPCRTATGPAWIRTSGSAMTPIEPRRGGRA